MTILTAFKAVADSSRLRMLVLLARAELAVTDLTRILDQSQPRVSRHLKLLTDAGLIERHKEGAWVFYRLAHGGSLGHVAHTLVDLADQDADFNPQDRARLAEIAAERENAADAYFAANAQNWDRLRSLHVAEEEVERALVQALIQSKPKTLLDVGTGTGRILDIMAPYIERGVGIDTSREMLNLARARLEHKHIHHCQVRQADMYKMPQDIGQFDAITFHQVLHYAEDPAAALREAVGLLARGGTIAVVDFAPHDKEFLREQHAHYRLGFSDKTIVDLLVQIGLRPETPRHLHGGELTVTLWVGKKPE